MDTKTNICGLFSPRRRQFAVPSYQRAFSWEVGTADNSRQIDQFITDLREQPEGVPYFLGHLLFETDKNNEDKYWIIDGQQRITTIVIFFSCLYRELKRRKIDIDFEEIREDYLKNKSIQKFETVGYDSNYFRNLIIEVKDIEDIADTNSKIRIKEAKDYFMIVLKNETSTEIILKWKRVIEEAKVTTDVVANKTEATQLFTFQNDRGKYLTNLEKLKAHLMFNIYLYGDSDKDPEDLIRYVEKEFEKIYEQLEKIEWLNEDQILNHYVTAFISTSGSALENVKNALKKANDKEEWIKSFSVNLKKSFFNINRIEERIKKRSFIGDILILDAFHSWPLLIKIYHYHHENIDAFEDIFRLMEITLFRMQYSSGDYRTNGFHAFAINYIGNSGELRSNLLNSAQNGFKSYWNFKDNFEKCLKGNYHYWPITKYLLWKYENHLREKKLETPMMVPEYLNLYHSARLENTIDHWAPQTPENKVYSQDFIDMFLHNLGNLVLSPRGRNSRDSNNAPQDRDCQSILLSRQELEAKKASWGEQEIRNRHADLVDFALGYWNPDNI